VTDNKIREAVDVIVARLVDEGRLIEGGFVAMIYATYPDLDSLPRDQFDQLHSAFFAGAQHIFASMTTMLDPGAEPTERDLERMDKIAAELDQFIGEYKLRHIAAEGEA